MLGFLMCLSCVRSQNEVRSIDCQQTNLLIFIIIVVKDEMLSTAL